MSTAPENEVVADTLAESKPAFLRRVRIRGYKSIAFCDVTLEPLTILVGRNASGKSNFVDALVFLRDIISFGVNEAVKRHGGADAILCSLREDRTIRIEIECIYTISADERDDDDDDGFLAKYDLEIDLPKKGPVRISYEQLKISQNHYSVGYTNSKGLVTSDSMYDQPEPRLWKNKDRPFLFSCSDTPIPEFYESLKTLTAYSVHPDIVRRLQLPNPGQLLERDGSNLASVIETTNIIEEGVIERVGRYLNAITESVELIGTVQYGDYETVRFRVKRADGERPLEFDAASMSDGTLRALAALVAAFQSIVPYGSPSLVAIEEPETSLHPTAMNALVDALDEATLRTQILLTTHSAEMLDNPTIRPENIRVVQMVDGQTIIGAIDGASVEIIRQKLSTLGGLERDNLLEIDPDDLERQQNLKEEPPQ